MSLPPSRKVILLPPSSWQSVYIQQLDLPFKISTQQKKDNNDSDSMEQEEMFSATKSMSDALAEQEQRHHPLYVPSLENDCRVPFGLEQIEPINLKVRKCYTVSYRKEVKRRIEKYRKLSMIRFCSEQQKNAWIAQAKRLHQD